MRIMRPFEETIIEYFINEKALIIDYFEQKGWSYKSSSSFHQIKMENREKETIIISPLIDFIENYKMNSSFYKDDGIWAEYIVCIDDSSKITYDFLFASKLNGIRVFKTS